MSRVGTDLGGGGGRGCYGDGGYVDRTGGSAPELQKAYRRDHDRRLARCYAPLSP